MLSKSIGSKGLGMGAPSEGLGSQGAGDFLEFILGAGARGPGRGPNTLKPWEYWPNTLE
jgi:hypothetical protein